MPDRVRYAYRFVNVWVARSAIDPTGQVGPGRICFLLCQMPQIAWSCSQIAQ